MIESFLKCLFSGPFQICRYTLNCYGVNAAIPAYRDSMSLVVRYLFFSWNVAIFNWFSLKLLVGDDDGWKHARYLPAISFRIFDTVAVITLSFKPKSLDFQL